MKTKTIEEFLSDLCSLDVKLWIEDNRLRCRAPKDVLTSAIKQELAERKEDILAFILNNNVTNGSDQHLIPRVPRQGKLLLSFAQQRLWFLAQLEPDSPSYNIRDAVRLEGKLNVEALELSFNEIVRRHEVLRSNFLSIEGQAVAVISEEKSIKLSILDISSLPIFQQEAEVKQQAIKEAQQPFDISSDHLLRIKLLRLGEQEHILLMTTHHIVSDGWSTGVLIEELATIYQVFCNGQPSPLAELPIQYLDFAAWQRQWLQGEVLETQLSYWLKQLENAPKVLELPTDHPRPAIQIFGGATYSFKLSKELSTALNKLSQQQGSTLFMTLLAGFQTLLWRYTAQKDIVVGSPIANRNRAEIEGLIGFFVNTLVLRTNLAGNPSFEELLKRVREVALEAYAHQDLPFEFLVERLKVERDLSYSPLFQVMFVLQNAPMSGLELPGLTLTPLEGDGNTAKFDLSLYMTETLEGLVGNLEYNIDLFEENTIQRMAAHLQRLLEGIVANPQQRLSELPFLTESEQHKLLREWNDTKVDYPQNKCIHQLFEAQVEKTPSSIAVAFEDQQLTYKELNKRANQLAHHLGSHGVKPEVLIGICVERSLDMVIGLLAILKAGGAYVPLDPTYPLERIQFILEQTQAPVLLTQASLLETIGQHKAQVICFDSDWHTIAQESQENLCPLATPDNLAYIIYTSGSTGKPKGVQIPHSALSNFLYSMREVPGLTQQDTLLAVTTYSFDIAALEIFLPIIVGARLVIATKELASDGIELSKKLTDSKATVMQATPATWQNILAAGWEGNNQLKILCGGEALPTHLATQLLQRCACLWNMYGPTETTIWSAASQIKADSNIIPISHPIANTQLYILDQYNQLVPVGVAGELCIGGEGLARGYFHRSDLTAEKFIPNPFSKQASRLYKTGDLARYLPNGDIEYLGRIDNQVKIRGFRIELGEIEAVISQYPAVRETVVLVCGDSVDSQRIVAYVVENNELTVTIPELRSFLESKLPNYMVPAAFVTLESLPLTPNGKVDRKALPAPNLTQVSSSDIIPASTPIENLLAGIWTEILGIEKVGIDENFFTLGGNSLIATRVISQIRQVFGVELALRYLFEKPTITELAKEIEKAKHTDLGLEAPPIKRTERGTELPLSFAQQRLWFLTQLEPNSSSYNIPAAVRLQGELNHNALEQSFSEIFSRHEALRTNFQTREGQAVAVISKDLFLTLPIFDISELPANQQQVGIKQQASQEVQKPFDLSNDHLIRLKLFRLGEQEHIVLLTMHHIVSDAWSIGVLIEELAAFYPAFCAGKPSPLSELPIQYADFAVWQRQWLQGKVLQTQLDYWKQQLGNTHPRLTFPKPTNPSKVESSQGAKQSFTLSKDLTEAINLLNRQEGVTLFMTLLTVFQVSLHCFTGTQDIRVGSPIASRNRVEIEKLIGFFINTLVLRIDLSGNPSFRELLVRSRQVTLGAYAHQDLPFEKLVEELQPERNLNHNPLYQAWFVLQNTPMPELKLPGLTLTNFEVESVSVRHDLLLQIWESSEELNGVFEYKTNLFHEASISRLIEHFKTVIHHVVAQPDTTLDEIATILTQRDEEQQRIQQQELQTVERQKLKMTKRKIIRN